MSSPRPWLCFLLGALLAPAPLGKTASVAETVAAIVAAPQPEYPYEARRSYYEGKGVFRIRFNSVGRAEDVSVVKSTGHTILDTAAIKALRRWQVKPRSLAKIEVPISFYLEGERAALLRALRGNLISGPAPKAPLETRLHNIGGYGRFQLKIDPETGGVIDVKILQSTSDRRLDDASLKAFRQWRFVPHTVEIVTVPVSF
jgi:TonB family protein